MFEAFMNGKDEEIKKQQQLHLHQKGEELNNRECHVNKSEEETRLREKKEGEHKRAMRSCVENKRVHFNCKRIWDKREETSCGVQGARDLGERDQSAKSSKAC